MKPQTNLPKRTTSMTDNQENYFDSLTNELKEALAVIESLGAEVSRLHKKTVQLEKEKKEVEEKDNTRSVIANEEIQKTKSIIQKAKEILQKSREDVP